MANYKTHRDIGIITSIVATATIIIISSQTKTIEQINIINYIFMIIMGTIGSIAPDIDLKNSTPSKLFKAFLLISTIILTIYYYQLNKEYIYELINNIELKQYLLSIILFINITIILFFIQIHNQLSKHRGLIHTIIFGILLSIIVFEILNGILFLINNNKLITVINTKIISIMFFVGYITHLILDEIYSVDFKNKKIKKSFGTALKIIDKKNIYGSIIVLSIIILYFLNKT